MDASTYPPTSVVLFSLKYTPKAVSDVGGLPVDAYVVHDVVLVNPTNERHEYSNGYTSYSASVCTSKSGKRYYYHRSVDRPYWVCLDGSKATLESYPLSGSRRYVRDGQPVSGSSLNSLAQKMLAEN